MEEVEAELCTRVQRLAFPSQKSGITFEEGFLDKLAPIWRWPGWRRALEPGHRKGSEGAVECQTEQKAQEEHSFYLNP